MTEEIEALAAQVLMNAPDGVIFADRDGVIRYWNSGAEEMFGYSSSEAIGQRMDIIIPENLQTRHWEGYERVMQRGEQPRRGPRELLSVPAVRKDGSRLSVEFTLQFVDHPELGTLAVAMLRDVTEQWTEMRELRKAAEARS